MLNVIVDRSLVDDTMYGSLSGNCLSKHHMVLRAELVSVARLTVDVQTFRDWRLDRAMNACTPRAVNGPFQSTEGLIVIVISKLLKRHWKAKHKALAYSRALRKIRGVVQRVVKGSPSPVAKESVGAEQMLRRV